MKKSIYAVAACLLLMLTGIGTASAQFSVGAELGLPSGNFSYMASTGFGVSGRYEANISNNLNWTASAGYLSFAGKDYDFGGGSIPFGNTTNFNLAGGVKYYFQEANSGFYGAADISANFLSAWGYSYNSGNGGGYNLASQSTTVIGINPGIGYRLPNWDFAARYNSLGDFSYIGLRVAYVFGGK